MGKKIEDTFAAMKQTHSRQYIYQLRQIARGLCAICPKPRATTIYCLDHAIQKREYARKRTGAKTRLNSRTYRLEKELDTSRQPVSVAP